MGLREDLRDKVRSAWNTDEGFNMQEKLKEIGRANLAKDYEACASKPAKEYAKCLRETAQKVGLRSLYRQAWGTA